MDEKQFNEMIEMLDAHERDHFRMVIETLIVCYTGKQSAVLVVQEEAKLVVIGVHATNWKAAEMLSMAFDGLDTDMHVETDGAVH